MLFAREFMDRSDEICKMKPVVLKIGFIIYLYACMCVCAHVCRYLQRPEKDIRFLEPEL